MNQYRTLDKGEIIQEGDEVYDDSKWVPVAHTIGQEAPDPRYMAHRIYRRPTKAKITDSDRIAYMEKYPCVAVDSSSGVDMYTTDVADGPWFDNIRDAIDHAIERKLANPETAESEGLAVSVIIDLPDDYVDPLRY